VQELLTQAEAAVVAQVYLRLTVVQVALVFVFFVILIHTLQQHLQLVLLPQQQVAVIVTTHLLVAEALLSNDYF
jgi:hypothetical protein